MDSNINHRISLLETHAAKMDVLEDDLKWLPDEHTALQRQADALAIAQDRTAEDVVALMAAHDSLAEAICTVMVTIGMTPIATGPEPTSGGIIVASNLETLPPI